MATMTANTHTTPSGGAAVPTRSAVSTISSSEMRYIMEGCRENTRLDGRACADYRCYSISSTHSSMDTAADGPLVLSNGSARILLPGGGTHVLCSVKADLVHPAPNAPNEGVVELNVDRALRRRHHQKADMELQSLLRRLWLPHALDRNGLCVVTNQYVWRLNIDLLILASEGNVVDVCAMVMRAALQQTKLPSISIISSSSKTTTDTYTKKSSTSDLAVDGDMMHASLPPGADRCPVIVTVHIVKCPTTVLLLDATLDEEACASCQVSVAVDQGVVCGIHKHNVGSLAFGVLAGVTDMAVQASKHVLKQCSNSTTTHTNEGTTTTQDLLHDYFSIR